MCQFCDHIKNSNFADWNACVCCCFCPCYVFWKLAYEVPDFSVFQLRFFSTNQQNLKSVGACKGCGCWVIFQVTCRIIPGLRMFYFLKKLQLTFQGNSQRLFQKLAHRRSLGGKCSNAKIRSNLITYLLRIGATFTFTNHFHLKKRCQKLCQRQF